MLSFHFNEKLNIGHLLSLTSNGITKSLKKMNKKTPIGSL